MDKYSRKTKNKLNAQILNNAFARNNGMHLNTRSKDILKVLELVSYSLTKGFIFGSNIALKIDKLRRSQLPLE